MTSMKKLIISIKIILISLLLFIIMGEISIRYIFNSESLQTRININKYAIANIKNINSKFDSRNLKFQPYSKSKIYHSEYSIEVSHDKYGFRNPCYNFKLEAEKILIGDSFVYGIGVNDKETLGCQLKKGGKNIYNAAIPGSGPKDYILILIKNQDNLKKLSKNNLIIDVIIFTGNDYEDLLSIDYPINESFVLKLDDNKNLLEYLNALTQYSSIVQKSYLLQMIKLSYVKISKRNEKENFYYNYAGSTFYKNRASDEIEKLTNSLNYFIKSIENVGFKFGKIYLLPDPSEISVERLIRDSKLGFFNIKEIDFEYKFKNLKAACTNLKINCVDLRKIFTSSDYYIYDNHIKKTGVIKLSKSIINF
jgi:hypothetical protein